MSSIDWKRVRSGLFQCARKNDSLEELPKVYAFLERVATLSGTITQSRQMLFRIGTTILMGGKTIVVPVCPDYSHDNGRYTFQSLGSGMPLLAHLHQDFLERVLECGLSLEVLFLVADQEADNLELCRAVGKTPGEFRALVEESVQATADVLAIRGWKALAMTSAIPDLAQREEVALLALSANPSFRNRLKSETLQRVEMYQRIRRGMSASEMEQRTLHTAAQYVVMGQYAGEHHLLLCNHSTTNLGWYLQTEAGILHNPVTVY